MTLKEELEILRGESIEVVDGDPMEIPCIETSDAEKVCKQPVVSICMITYNHEPYIRQAIEGVMMQKTDFEFELVIGEDCSQDRTREICFEYQKKYPDKIRVLWWHENATKFGGNGRRTLAHCRGEFIAFCEGDDYWIDPLKLQKQVDAMRQFPSVGYCVTGARVLSELPASHPRMSWVIGLPQNEDGTYVFPMKGYRSGLVPRNIFWKNRNTFPRTATVLYRRSAFEYLKNKLEIFSWKLRMGDMQLWHGFALFCDAFFFSEDTAIYRLSQAGATVSGGGVNRRLQIDFGIGRIYFLRYAKESWSELKGLFKQVLFQRINLLLDEKAMTISQLFSLINGWAIVSGHSRVYWAVCSVVYFYRRFLKR